MSFKAPIGSEEERNSGKIWPGQWADATPYLTHYAYGIHTGADLNLNLPGAWDADAHSGVYAMGDGIVTYAQRWPNPKYWGNIIVVNHGIVDGKPLFSRYAHVENIKVSVGQSVGTGHPIAQVGNGFGLFAYHLHFDISTTELLRTEPNNWPAPKSSPNEALLKQHYVDPRAWLMRPHVIESTPTDKDNAVSGIKPTPTPPVWYVIAPAGAQVRKDASISAEQVGLLPHGSKLSIETQGGNRDGYTWGHISGGEFNGFWLAIRKQDQSESYVSTNPPRQ